MLKPLLALTALLCMAVSSWGTSLVGRFTWVTGDLVTAITISANTQTVTLKVGTSNQTFTGTYVPGDVGTTIPAGTQIQILEKGSIPFGGTYKTGAVAQVGAGYGGSNAAARRSVPLSTSGAILDNIAGQVQAGFGGEILMILPDVTVGTLQFVNGLTFQLVSPIASYDLAVAAGSATSFSFVTFPAPSVAPYHVIFAGYGNGEVHISGTGAGSFLAVAATTKGSPTIVTLAEFIIYPGR